MASPFASVFLRSAFLYGTFQLANIAVFVQHTKVFKKPGDAVKSMGLGFIINALMMTMVCLGIMTVSTSPDMAGTSVPTLLMVQKGIGKGFMTNIFIYHFIVSVMNGTDSYLDKAGIGDYVVISMGADSKASIDEILHEMESIRDYRIEPVVFGEKSNLKDMHGEELEAKNSVIYQSIEDSRLKFFDKENKQITQIKPGHAYGFDHRDYAGSNLHQILLHLWQQILRCPVFHLIRQFCQHITDGICHSIGSEFSTFHHMDQAIHITRQ